MDFGDSSTVNSKTCQKAVKQLTRHLYSIGKKITKLQRDISLFRSKSEALTKNPGVDDATRETLGINLAKTELLLRESCSKLQKEVIESSELRERFYDIYYAGYISIEDFRAIEKSNDANVGAMEGIEKSFMLAGSQMAERN